MFHGPPPTKIKRELSPSKELSPCSQDRSPMPYGEKCLYSYRYFLTYPSQRHQNLLVNMSVMTNCPHCPQYSAYERKPTAGFKPLTPPSTPVSPCGSANTLGTRPLHEQTPPPVSTTTLGQRVLHGQPSMTKTSPSQTTLTHHSQSPPFAVPCPPLNHDPHFSNEPRSVSAWF